MARHESDMHRRLRQAIADRNALINAIQNIDNNWSQGDLAGAVNLATELVDEIEAREKANDLTVLNAG